MTNQGKLLVFIILFQAFPARPVLFAQGIEKDTVRDSVICSDDNRQSYALYCPAGYDESRHWPLVLIFDPGANGTAGVDAFVEAGRRYGFILACSNNSRNGPMQNNLTAAAAVLRDVQERFNVDERRIYVAGFSGGSRFAMTLAVMNGKISGVIGCGAGLPNDRNFIPRENAEFLYFGIVGSRDMNYQEMLALPDFFNDRTHVISYIRTFHGGHQWPSSNLVTGAVEWLILKSMDRKVIPDDPLFRSYLENKTQRLIDDPISSGNLVGAVRYMSFAVRDFRGSPFGTHVGVLLGEYKNSSGYKKAIRARNKIMSDENDRRNMYMNYLEEILKSKLVPDSASVWWKKEVSTLLILRDKGNEDKSAMAYRLLNFISILSWEEGTNVYSYRLYSHAAFLFGICTLSDSENPNTWYYLARSLAEEGKTGEAVDALFSAVKKGFNSRGKIEADPAFHSIHGDARYKELIGKMR